MPVLERLIEVRDNLFPTRSAKANFKPSVIIPALPRKPTESAFPIEKSHTLSESLPAKRPFVTVKERMATKKHLNEVLHTKLLTTESEPERTKTSYDLSVSE